MGVLSDAAAWVEALYALERTDLVDADLVANGDQGGKANLQPLQLGKRTRYLKNLLAPIAAAISNDALVRLLLEHGVDIDMRAPLLKALSSAGGVAASFSTDSLTGSLAMAHPIVGTFGSPYAVHGAIDLDLGIAAGVFPRPCPKEMGIVRLVDSGGAPGRVDVEASPPTPVPGSWARAYTKTVTNATGMTVSWTRGSGAPLLDTMMPFETVTYVRGPGIDDWFRSGTPRGLVTVNQNKTGTDSGYAIASTSYVTHWYETILNVRAGDTLHVGTWQDNDAPAVTAGVAARLQITSSPTVGVGTIYSTTETNATYGTGVGIPDQLVAPANGTYYVHLQAKKWSAGHATFNVVRRRICWRQERRGW